MTALPDKVRSWLQERGYNPFGDLCAVKPGSGWTIMHQACDAGALNVCQWLLNHGAASTIRSKDSEGWTPMFRACECGHILIAQWLFEVGAKDDIRTRNNLGWTKSCSLARAAVPLCAAYFGAFNINSINGFFDRWTKQPMLGACREGHLHVLKWLCRVGAAADVRSCSLSGFTPMHCVGICGHLHVGRWLVADGGLELRDLVVADLQDRTPLSIACSHHPAVAAWLIVHGAASSSVAATSAESAPASSCGGITAATAATDTTTPPSTSSSSYCNTGSIESSGCVGAGAGAAASSSSGTNDSSGLNSFGNVDEKVLLRNAENSDVRKSISENLEEWLHLHAVFTRLVLPAIQQRRVQRHVGTSDFSTISTTANNAFSEGPRRKVPTIGRRPFFTTSKGAEASALRILSGHEDSILALIADFVGVLRGRQLRNAREALALLAPAMSPGSRPKESEQAATPPAARNAKKDLGEWCLFSFDY